MNKYPIVLGIAVLLICVGLSGCFYKELTSIDEGKDSYNLSIVSSTINWKEYRPIFSGDTGEGFTIDNFNFRVRNDGLSSIFFGKRNVTNMNSDRITYIHLSIGDTDTDFSYDNVFSNLYSITDIGYLYPNTEETITIYFSSYPYGTVQSMGEYDYNISLYLYNGTSMIYKIATYNGTTMVE